MISKFTNSNYTVGNELELDTDNLSFSKVTKFKVLSGLEFDCVYERDYTDHDIRNTTYVTKTKNGIFREMGYETMRYLIKNKIAIPIEISREYRDTIQKSRTISSDIFKSFGVKDDKLELNEVLLLDLKQPEIDIVISNRGKLFVRLNDYVFMEIKPCVTDKQMCEISMNTDEFDASSIKFKFMDVSDVMDYISAGTMHDASSVVGVDLLTKHKIKTSHLEVYANYEEINNLLNERDSRLLELRSLVEDTRNSSKSILDRHRLSKEFSGRINKITYLNHKIIAYNKALVSGVFDLMHHKNEYVESCKYAII